MCRFVRGFQPFLAVFCLALLRHTVFACEHNVTNKATNVTEIKIFELRSNVTLSCGNENISSSTLLSWSKDENLLLNITSHNSTLVLSDLTAEDSGLYVCKANTTQLLRIVQLNMRTNGEEVEEEEEEIQEGGLTHVDYIAIAIGLGLTTFLVVSIAVLLYRADKRLKHAKHMQKWRVTVKGRENLAVEDDVIAAKPVPRNDFHLRNGPKPVGRHKRAPANMTPAEYRWLETLGRENEVDGNQNRIGGATMWRVTAYV